MVFSYKNNIFMKSFKSLLLILFTVQPSKSSCFTS